MKNAGDYKTIEDYISESERDVIARRNMINEMHSQDPLIEELLAEPERRGELCTLYLCNKDVWKYTNEWAELGQILEIYNLEKNNNESKTILDRSLSRSELECMVRELKYLLIRIELAYDRDNDSLICDYVKENDISPYAVCVMVNTVNISEFDVFFRLSKIFLERVMLRHTLLMLEKCDEIEPGREDILTLMANMYALAGHSDKEKECLSRIKH